MRNLLPLDAYPLDPTTGRPISGELRRRTDRRLRGMRKACPIPTEPGEYIDSQADRWVLNPDGSWTDRHGVSKSAAYAPGLVLYGPFHRIETINGPDQRGRTKEEP